MGGRDSGGDTASDEKSKHDDPEYMLKGVQAFGLGVALFAASLAVGHAAFNLGTSSLASLWVKVPVATLLALLCVPISLFGCLSITLGLSMTGFWQPKGAIPIVSWALTTTWLVISYVLIASTGSP